MSKLAYVEFLGKHSRYEFAKKITDKLSNISLFGKIKVLEDNFSLQHQEELLEKIIEEIFFPIFMNTPETAEDHTLLSQQGYLEKKYNITINEDDEVYGTHLFFINIPDETDDSWLLLDGVLVDLNAYDYWLKNLMENGLPPRTSEEIEADRLRELEDQRQADLKAAEEKRLADQIKEQAEREAAKAKAEAERIANLRPKKMGRVAVVRLHDSLNFEVAVFKLDINNTRVIDMKKMLASRLKIQPSAVYLSSTNAFWPDQVVNLHEKSKTNIPLMIDTANRFMSVLDGEKHGTGPAVGVPPNQRSTLADNVRLADMKGSVMVYLHNAIPRTPFNLVKFLTDVTIDIVLG